MTWVDIGEFTYSGRVPLRIRVYAVVGWSMLIRKMLVTNDFEIK